jgi:hypothetical protein
MKWILRMDSTWNAFAFSSKGTTKLLGTLFELLANNGFSSKNLRYDGS